MRLPRRAGRIFNNCKGPGSGATRVRFTVEVLEADPVLDGAQVVAQMNVPSGLNSRQHTLPARSAMRRVRICRFRAKDGIKPEVATMTACVARQPHGQTEPEAAGRRSLLALCGSFLGLLPLAFDLCFGVHGIRRRAYSRSCSSPPGREKVEPQGRCWLQAARSCPAQGPSH